MAQLSDKWICCDNKFVKFSELATHIEKNHFRYNLDVQMKRSEDTENSNEFKPIAIQCKKCYEQSAVDNDLLIHFISNHVIHCKSCENCEFEFCKPIRVIIHKCGNKSASEGMWQRQSQQKNKNKNQVRSNQVSTVQIGKFKHCHYCSQLHSIHDCNKFLGQTAKKRTLIAQGLKLCYKCLERHFREKTKCKENLCTYCDGPHSILLCYKLENFNRWQYHQNQNQTKTSAASFPIKQEFKRGTLPKRQSESSLNKQAEAENEQKEEPEN